MHSMRDRARLTIDLSQPPEIPEEAIAAADNVLRSGWLHRYGETLGENSEVSLLEDEFAEAVGSRYCVAANSCGATLFLALVCCGVKPGDRVLMNSFTLAPVPGAIAHAGATHVLVEIGDDLTIDLADLERKAQSSGAKVLLLSHMRGHSADMIELMEVANRLGLTVIEDCAHTMGATWAGKASGTYGKVGCFSLQAYKHVNGGEGGLLVTDDDDLAARAILYSGSYMLFGQHRRRPPDHVFARWKDVTPNYSMRMSNLVAAIARPDHHDRTRLFVAFARDITQRRSDEAALRQAKEEAQEASKAKSRFLAVISHEMRTPLNGILGVIQLLNRTQLDGEQKRLINVARLSGEMLLDQINDVLDLTKMQAGRLELDPNVFELATLPQTVKEIMAFDAAERGNAIHIDLDPRMPRWLIGDANRLRQILLNLVANANKFTRDGKITIASKVETLDAAHVSIELSVTDTGIGIPKERIAQLFSEFGTLDNSFQRKYGGTGLGLVISRRIAELMGGTIEVESTFGQGSRFWLSVTLPTARNEQLPVRQSRDQPEASPERTCARILLAEDNQTNALIARALLTGAGHQVHIVGDGQDAVRAVSQRQFDLVLLDISMPVMDGLEATRLIRALPEPQCSVPIVAMTAHAFAEDRKMILEAGINGYLAKPLRRETLLEAVSLYSSRSDNSEQPNETHADATPDIPLIDEREMSQFLSDVGPAIAPHLISQFSADVQKQVQIMIDASKRHDHAAVRKAAHALAGCSVTIGASRLTAAARAIEAAYKGPNVEVSTELLSELATIQAETLREITDCQQPGHNRNSMPARSAA